MQAVPTVSTPGVYSPPDRKPEPTAEEVTTELLNDTEVGDALADLVFALKNGISKAKAFDGFEDRIFYLFLRAEQRLEER